MSRMSALKAENPLKPQPDLNMMPDLMVFFISFFSCFLDVQVINLAIAFRRMEVR